MHYLIILQLLLTLAVGSWHGRTIQRGPFYEDTLPRCHAHCNER